MTKRFFFLICLMFSLSSIHLMAKTNMPTPNPIAIFATPDGEEQEGTEYTGSAPVMAQFKANVEDLGSYTARYEWRIYKLNPEVPLINRFDEDIEYTFMESGTFFVQLYATFINGNDTINYPEEGEANPFVISIAESRLEVPNAFSPNGDGINDVFKVKDNYQSIISFRATIFNR